MKYHLKESQKIVDDWIQDIGFGYFSELTNMAILTEEVGEVARVISRRYGDQSFKDSDRDIDLAEELADVLFVLICLANQPGIDLQPAFHQSIEKKPNRDRVRHERNQSNE